MMRTIAAIVICFSPLFATAQEHHIGLDAAMGIRYNLLRSQPERVSGFNGSLGCYYKLVPRLGDYFFEDRLTIEDHFFNVDLPGRANLNLAFWNVSNSFQVHRRLNEYFEIYLGLNFRYYIDANVSYQTSYNSSSTFVLLTKDVDEIGRDVDSLVNKFNAGVELGGSVKLGDRFRIGVRLDYYVLKTLRDDLTLEYTTNYTDYTGLRINMQPVNIGVSCKYDF